MTDKELRKLKRRELLEILYYQQKELEDLRQENQELKNRTNGFAHHGNHGDHIVNAALPEDFHEQLGQIVQKAMHDYYKNRSSAQKGNQRRGKGKKR